MATTPDTERAARSAALPDPRALRALSTASGLDLAAFRSAHVARTVERAVARLGVPGVAALTAAIRTDAAQRARFRRAVAVSTTGMFRDPAQFELLDRLMRADARDGRPLKVWSIGASDGSELCSLALLLRDQGALAGATLLGSDLMPENVALARERSRERLEPDVLAALKFEERDVTTSAPPGTWDVVVCRNVLIHLAPGPKAAMLDRATGALAPGGLLLLGRAERLPLTARRGLQDAGTNAYRSVA